MDKCVLMSYRELKSIIRSEIMESVHLFKPQPEHDTISLVTALQMLDEHGLPTSQAKMYKLTSAGAIPHSKYGNKLVFSRKELLEWMNEQIVKIGNVQGTY